MANINIPELIQQATSFLGSVINWFNSGIGHGFLSFIKSILIIIVNILQFFVQIANWAINHI